MLVLRSRRRPPLVTEQWFLRTALTRIQLGKSDLNSYRALASSTRDHKSTTRYAAVKKERPVKPGYKPSLAERSDYAEALKIQNEARKLRRDEYQESLDAFGDGESQD
jgi:hypothetical protein